MTPLIERLRNADGPSRELDAEIAKAVGVAGKARNIHKRGHYIGGKPVVLRVAYDYPAYTASLDAALSLVPNSPQRDDDSTYWWWRVEIFAGAEGSGKSAGLAELYNAAGANVKGIAATPALALCIASLLARGME